MNRERAKELLPVIQAFAEGKQIQYRISGYEDWRDVDDEDGIIDGTRYEYRVKAEQYRPFKDCDELIATWQKMMGYPAKQNTMPLIWIKCKSNINKNGYGEHIGETNCITAFGKDFVRCEIGNPTLEVLYDDFTFLDGTPCGVEE